MIINLPFVVLQCQAASVPRPRSRHLPPQAAQRLRNFDCCLADFQRPRFYFPVTSFWMPILRNFFVRAVSPGNSFSRAGRLLGRFCVTLAFLANSYGNATSQPQRCASSTPASPCATLASSCARPSPVRRS